MLEIPALATAVAGLCILLVLPRTRWHLAEIASAVLFGLSLQIKLISIIWLPLAALILWFRKMDEVLGMNPRASESGVSAGAVDSQKHAERNERGFFDSVSKH